jgi:hypothetical protein
MEIVEFLVRRPPLLGGALFAIWYMLRRRRQPPCLSTSSDDSPPLDPLNHRIDGEVTACDASDHVSTAATLEMIKRRQSLTRSRKGVVALAAMCVMATDPVYAEADKTNIMSAVAAAQSVKTAVEIYVADLKSSTRPPNPAYAECQSRYFSAYKLYNAFVSQVIAYLRDHKGNPTDLRAIASEVDQRIADFTEYAAYVTLGKRCTMSGLTHAAGVLVQCIGDRKQLHISQRLATHLQAHLSWQSWADIGAEAPVKGVLR